MAELSPMMQQYLKIKEQNNDVLLFFRLGDFYELFFEDAKTASRELELVLTGRDCGLEERAPMCGVPYHSYEGYVARLVAKGYKVAICEQMEDPATAKGIVRRDIVRVITPGTVLESSMLDEGKNNYICTVYAAIDACSVCFADVSTGEVHVTRFDAAKAAGRVNSELSRYQPSEVLLSEGAQQLDSVVNLIRNKLQARSEVIADECFEQERARQLITEHFGQEKCAELENTGGNVCVGAVGAMLSYIRSTQMTGLERVNELEYYISGEYMRLDATARRNLELTETMRSKEKRGSLLWVLDRTKTAMGKRLIRKWIEQPLLSPTKILSRQNAVEELCSSSIVRGDIVDALSGVSDIERLMTRIVYGSANARDLRALAYTAGRMPQLRACLESASSGELRGVYNDIDCLEDITGLIESAIDDDPPLTVKEGGIIRPGYNDQVDRLRSDMDGGKDILAEIEASEREKTGIPKLKLGYNRVFGYYIEITNSYKSLVPEHYIRKQTLTNCERYITPELKELESRVIGARDRVMRLEYELFEDIRKQVATALERVQKTAHAIAKLDVLASFACVAVDRRYCRPLVNTSGKILVKDSRHPVVEAFLDVPFVPNDVTLDNHDNRLAIITGPNMAGKSTYMRQTALIVLMAHMGSFVPASSAEIGIVDGIYTRVGASDDLTAGQSTFMVEMSEIAEILESATANSLLILDEIGRGTSTYDGMSIARAVLEYCAESRKLGAKTLFATHYHELTALEGVIKGVKNYNIAAKKNGDDITFLRRIVRGGADDSYGIEVAKLAGVPGSVIKRAKAILASLAEEGVPTAQHAPQPEQTALSLTSPGEEEAIIRLKMTDVNTLSPIEALSLLDTLIKLVK